MLTLMILAAATAAQLPLDIVSGVRLGDTRDAVERAWNDIGPISEDRDKYGVVHLHAGRNTASLCNDRVVNVSHEMSDDFNVFAQLGEVITQAYGPAELPEVFAVNSAKPETLKSGVIRLRWAKGPNFILQYYEINGTRRAVETLAGVNLCEKPKN